MNNREIKFRLWSKHYEEFFYSDCKDFLIGLDGKVYGRKNVDSNYEDWSDCYEVQQFTGLKDINNKEIYEGDIIFCSKNHYEGNLICQWSKDGAFLFRIQNDDCSFHFYYQEIQGMIKVVGNIYENPELIKSTP